MHNTECENWQKSKDENSENRQKQNVTGGFASAMRPGFGSVPRARQNHSNVTRCEAALNTLKASQTVVHIFWVQVFSLF